MNYINNIFCDKPGHAIRALRAYEKDGIIYVDTHSCDECLNEDNEKSPDKKSLKEIISGLKEILYDVSSIKDDADSLEDSINDLIEELEEDEKY